MIGKSWLTPLLHQACLPHVASPPQLELPLPRAFLAPGVVRLEEDGAAKLSLQLRPGGLFLELQLPVSSPRSSFPEEEDAEPAFAVELSDPCMVLRFAPPHDWDLPVHASPCYQVWQAELCFGPRASARVDRLPGGAWLLLPLLGAGEAARRERAAGILPLLRFIADALSERGGRLAPETLTAAARLLYTASCYLPPERDAAALRIARSYGAAELMRWTVYELLVNDSSGRLAQMAEVCPGVLILVRGLGELGNATEAEAILQAVRQGRKLGQVLGLCVDTWVACLTARGLFSAHLPASPELCRLQRLRLRRVGRHVRPGVLMAPFALGLAAEDIPTEPEQNARWYQLTASEQLWPWQLAQGELNNDGWAQLFGLPLPAGVHPRPEQLLGLGGFVSRHWRVLAAQAEASGKDLGRVLGELCDFVRYTGRFANRKTDPLRLLADCQHWHEHERWQLRPALPPETPLPCATLPVWSTPDGHIAPLTTVGELVAESQRMHHCVAVRAPEAVADQVQLFHAELRGRPLTVMTRRKRGRLRLREAAGLCDRQPTAEEREWLSCWMAWLANHRG